ncbi:MAG: hypothetical protein ACI8UR_001204 [Natronomonas sp.]|jgi:hypothetical protein|uniref:hypothetical protein n=1 Tax=Natronomonas sp. TaxID=2184060 RepID=UPI00398984E0
MATAPSSVDRPVTVYVTAQLLCIPLALLVAWELVSAGLPPWGAVACWLALSAYLSRKRLPSGVLGAGLQLGAVITVLAPLVPYLVAAVEGANVTAVDIATELFGPALAFTVFAAFAYAVGLFLKRRARRKLTRQARKGLRR